MKKDKQQKLFSLLKLIFFLGSIVFIIYGIKTELFTSQKVLEDFLIRFGLWAPIVLIFLQAIQVIFPILPGGIGLLAGVIIFGPYYGFIYNYIGICLGSVIAFLLSKRYGMPIINVLFPIKLRDKYMKWVNKEQFKKIFTIAIFMPIAPDDFLCYLAGTTNMRFKTFVTIILLGKPLAITLYSFGLNFVFERLFL